MSIAVESLSFSYAAPKSKKSRSKNESLEESSWFKRRKQRNADKAEQSHEEEALWGNRPDAVWTLRNINFQLNDGEFFGIAGHTGSGKSTLIQHMNGLLHPTQGRVLVDGQDISDKKIAASIRGKVGLVFQYPEHQLFAASVYEDIAFGPRNLGLSADEVDERVREALVQVSLDFDELHEKSPFELSGGQQRRVAFAGVLAMRPSTLILDEPVAGLDPVTRIDFLDFIAGLHRDGLSVVMVSHSMNDLARFCDRVLVLKEGEQYLLGTPDEVFTQGKMLNEIGLSAPSAQKLVDTLKNRGIELGSGLYDADRLADDLCALYKESKN
ncbi:MAG: energy-coupling factor transporter ATPase [Raoultibacter sp.]|jgi:energy-coupling factor transport system ATP-binding protein